jgi:hypothetical protein
MPERLAGVTVGQVEGDPAQVVSDRAADLDEPHEFRATYQYKAARLKTAKMPDGTWTAA